MKEKETQDRKQLAHPKWKAFFDVLIWLGVLLFLAKIVMMGLDKLIDLEFVDTVRKSLNFGTKYLPFILMVIGGIGSDSLKNKFVD